MRATTGGPSRETSPVLVSNAPHFVLELQGVPCDSLSAKALGRTFRSVSGAMAGSAPLASMQAMGRDGDTCTVMCVGLTQRGRGKWIAIDMTPRASGGTATRFNGGRRQVGRPIADPVLTECFARHAYIDTNGAVVRNEAASGDCPSCARAWAGFCVLMSRPAPSARVNMARLGAIMATHGIGRLRPVGVCSVPFLHACIHTLVLIAGSTHTESLDRARRAVVALGVQIDALVGVCLWADRLDVPAALRIVVDADMRVGDVFPSESQFGEPQDPADAVTRVAVSAAVIVARANRAAADLLRDTPALDADAVAEAVNIAAGLCGRMMSDPAEHDDSPDSAGQLVAAILYRARAKVAAADCGAPRGTKEPSPATSPPPPPPRQSSAQDVGDAVHAAAADVEEPPARGPRCAAADCRGSGRRIASGCVVTVHCTAGCRVALHRACWKAAGIAPVDAMPCLTPDCWGKVARVTSVRLHAVEHVPRLMWEATARAPLSTDGMACTPADRPRTTASKDSSRRDDRQTQAQSPEPMVDVASGDDDTARDPHALEVDTPASLHDVDDERDPGERAPITGGTPYQKEDAPRDTAPIRHRHPRNRAGKRQRRRFADKQQERLVLLGLDDPPDPAAGASETRQGAATLPIYQAADYADDALWPPFFVPSAPT